MNVKKYQRKSILMSKNLMNQWTKVKLMRKISIQIVNKRANCWMEKFNKKNVLKINRFHLLPELFALFKIKQAWIMKLKNKSTMMIKMKGKLELNIRIWNSFRKRFLLNKNFLRWLLLIHRDKIRCVLKRSNNNCYI